MSSNSFVARFCADLMERVFHAGLKAWLQEFSGWEFAKRVVFAGTVVLAIIVAPLSGTGAIQWFGTEAISILAAWGLVGQTDLVVSWFESPLLAGHLSRDNIRFTLTTIATAQASILAIVFSVTFIGVQLVSTSYTLRTLGQINPISLFAKTYVMLGVSILFDIGLLLLLPSTLTDPFAFWAISAVLLFVFSLFMLQNSVKETINLSTPSGLAHSIRRAVSIRDHFHSAESYSNNKSKDSGPTDPLKSLILSAIRSREWGTVEEGYDELVIQINDMTGQFLRIQYEKPTQGRLKRLLIAMYTNHISGDDLTKSPPDAFKDIFVTHYRRIIISTIEANEQQKFREYISDLYSFGVLCFRVGLPQAGKFTFDGLTETMQSLDDDDQNSQGKSTLLSYRIELLVPAVKLGHIEAALHICKSLREDLIDSPEEATLTEEVRQAGIVAISWSIVELLQGEGNIEPSFRNLSLAKGESEPDHLEEDLLIRLTDFHQDMTMEWGLRGDSKTSDETTKLIAESWELIGRHSQKVGRERYLDIMIFHLLSDVLTEKSARSDQDISDEQLSKIFSRAAIGVSRDRVIVCIEECREMLETERDKVGSGSQPGWQGDWIDSLGNVGIGNSIELLNAIPDQIASHYRREILPRIGIDSICAAFHQDCSIFLGQDTSVVTKLDDSVFLCERDRSGHSIVVVREELTAENIEAIESIFHSLKDSVFGSHIDPDLEVLTCHVEEGVDCSNFNIVEKSLWENTEGNQAKMGEYTFRQPRRKISETVADIVANS